MKRFALVIGLVACVAAGAWAADFVVERAQTGPSVPEAPGYDATFELKWDSGAGRWMVHWYTGADSWVGNDFDVSTIKTYGGIKTYRTQSRLWPNQRWDGFRIAIYAFGGGVPGSMMWPTSGTPKFVMPSGPEAGWKDFDVNWVLPGTKRFMAAQEQFYNGPEYCDPYIIDNNLTFMGHSWQYYEGSWKPLEGFAGYRNLMVRVIVDNEQNPAVAPSSIGRVKALYY